MSLLCRNCHQAERLPKRALCRECHNARQAATRVLRKPPPKPKETLCETCKKAPRIPRSSRCRDCYNDYIRAHYHANHERALETRKELYQKHVEKRRAEAALTKKQNRVRYSLLEWFRKRGISAAELGDGQLDALVDMKKALIASQEEIKALPP